MPIKPPVGAKRCDSFNADPSDINIIGIDYGDKDHILYDERITRPLDPAYISMIVKHGVEVIPSIDARSHEGRIEVVDGRQRVRSAREANKIRVANGIPPIRVKVNFSYGTPSTLVVQQIAFNTTAAPTPRENGIHAAKLIRQGCSVADIAERLGGVAESTVKRWLRLAEDRPSQTYKKRGRKPDTMMPIAQIRGLHLKWTEAVQNEEVADEENLNTYACGYRDALEEILMLNRPAEEEPENLEPDMFAELSAASDSEGATDAESNALPPAYHYGGNVLFVAPHEENDFKGFCVYECEPGALKAQRFHGVLRGSEFETVQRRLDEFAEESNLERATNDCRG